MTDHDNDITAGIAAIGNPTPEPTQTPAPAPEPTPAPTPAPAQATPEPAPAPAPKAKLPFDDDFPTPTPAPAAPAKKSEVPPEGQKSVRGGSLEEFRKNYETTKKERDELKTKYDALEKAREEGTRAEVAKATAEYEKKIAELQSRYEDAETRLKFTDYTRSGEYKDKYEKPLESAWKEAIKDLDGATIELEDGSERPATWADIRQLVDMPSIQAAKHASKLFGDAAPAILQHRSAIQRIERDRKQAIEDYRTKGAEREREMATRSTQQRERLFEVFNGTVKEYETADAKLYGRPEDPEAQKFWDKGNDLVDLAVKRRGLDETLPEDQQSEVLTRAQAAVAARARAFGPLRLRVMNLEREIEELRGKQATFTKSEPGQGSDRQTEASEGEVDITKGIWKL
jgi:Skp family chaperone for outer membrane proteins